MRRPQNESPAARWEVACGIQRSEGDEVVVNLRKKNPSPPILFIGVGENAGPESAALSDAGIPLFPVITNPPAAPQVVDGIHLVSRQAILKFGSRLKSPGRAKVMLYMESLLDLEKDPRPETEGARAARDEVAQLARLYDRAETGDLLLERAIISGHHRPGGTDFFSMVDGRSLDFAVLTQMAEAFPAAASRIRHVMLSGCNTLTEPPLGKKPQESLLEMFPNLRTVWGYAVPEEHSAKAGPHEGKSPAFIPGSTKRGSLQHILRWEAATRGDPTAIPEESYRDLTKARPNTLMIISIACR